MEPVARPYHGWVAECLPKAFHPSQQAPTEPSQAPFHYFDAVGK